jgi:RNA polymerase sigma-70 factor, ECF subfamily
LQTLDDTSLVKTAQQGSRAAFDCLVSRHKTRVYALARHLLRDGHLAEDLTVEAFAQAYRSLGEFRGDSSFATWLQRIVVNVCTSQLRRSLRRRIDEVPLAETSAEIGHLRHDLLERALLRQDLFDGLGRIKQAQRTALLLYYFEGLTYEEIAQVMSAPVGTIRSHMSRGVAAMRKLMESGVAVEVVGGTHNEPALEPD